MKWFLSGILLVVLDACAGFSQVDEPGKQPVLAVAKHVFTLTTDQGSAELPIDISLNWDRPQPSVKRAVVILHGKSRDAEGYFHTALRAGTLERWGVSANTLVIAPQFLNEVDVRAHNLSAEVMRWREGTWESGSPATSPIRVSSYVVIDSIIRKLSDQQLFPNLKLIVIAGHSGGGQAVQRYAAIGQAELVSRPSVHLRYVIANPSSYLYFSGERPEFDGDNVSFRPYTGSDCPGFNDWRYGTRNLRNQYVRSGAAFGWSKLEDTFAAKDVVYLLGTLDIDPHEKDLDTSCAGELQGSNRLLRGRAYYAWLSARHLGAFSQSIEVVPGVAHSAGHMFTSEAGVEALYGPASPTTAIDGEHK